MWQALNTFKGRCVFEIPRRPEADFHWKMLGCDPGQSGQRRDGAGQDRLHLRWTTEQHVPEVEVQVKRRRTASLNNQECHLYPRRSQQQQQVPVVDFQAELRQAFLAEIPRGG
ncbi:SNRPN upstream reading frame protein-like [Balaenoptera musculus]|uniref:SNRPN upstream reading frame protein-like n=1 Tax=Balaenoptera musculus TaxID=9771 RepID=A0A8B8Z0Y5_BALMU|nr:SNRPN upstream reading frame protein-like [Balaenoptera musculus]